MKHRVLAVILGFVIALAGVGAVPAESGLIWVVEPTWSYSSIGYCQYCDLFREYEFERGANLSMGEKFDELRSQFPPYNEESYYLCWGHGGGFPEYKYDEKKELYGYYYTDEGGPEFVMKQRDELFQESFTANRPLAFQKVDTDRVKTIEHEDDYWTEYDLSDAQVGDKYAIAYNGIFFTDFIYEDYDRNTAPDMIAVKLGGKWGVIGKNGDTLVPFELDDITFIDENNAFAKYGGVYGILDVSKYR